MFGLLVVTVIGVILLLLVMPWADSYLERFADWVDETRLGKLYDRYMSWVDKKQKQREIKNE